MPSDPDAIEMSGWPALCERGGRILLAGGDATGRRRLAALLARRWTVSDVDRLADAAAAAREHSLDLLLAIAGPGEGGGPMVRALREDPRTRTLGIVLVGREQREQEGAALAALAAGADDYLPADTAEDELLLRVSARLELARARADALRCEQAGHARALAEARAREEFLSLISHELRTPLGAILIWTQILRHEQPERADGTRALEMIERSTRSLAQLMDDLLDLSRMIAGKLRVEASPVDLSAVVSAAVESARPAARDGGVDLSSHIDTGLPPVAGDASRLQQVAANLISNAINFTPEGGRVEVRLERAGSDARLVVADTGSGIAGDMLPQVFERFRPADGTTTHRAKGLGLGLALARHLVELHGGRIEADSAGRNQGSTFTVTLPLSGLAAEPPAAEPPPARLEQRLHGLRVLVVDDEADTREALRVLLTRAGAEVTLAASAASALEAVVASPPDVLLSDIAMPQEDGYSLIRQVRALPPERGGRLPAAALTAYAATEHRAKALAAGYHEHLAKPVDPEELISVTARLARRHADVLETR